MYVCVLSLVGHGTTVVTKLLRRIDFALYLTLEHVCVRVCVRTYELLAGGLLRFVDEFSIYCKEENKHKNKHNNKHKNKQMNRMKKNNNKEAQKESQA